MKNLLYTGALIFLFSCGSQSDNQEKEEDSAEMNTVNPIQEKVDEFAEFTLNTDLSVLSDNEKKMLPLLIEASQIMDKLFWKEAYGDKDELMASLNDAEKAFAKINYGPWERLNDDKPFVEGVGPKPAGAQFYPTDMTKEEFEQWDEPNKKDQYSFVRRNEDGGLYLEPYHVAFKEEVTKAADLLRQAAELCEEEGLKKYLTLRADALLSDDYLASDMAWMDMKNNTIDVVIGPIENYEDKLYNYRSAHEAYVLIKDKTWSERLEKFASFLPELQQGLPVADAYKKEMPGTSSQLNAYDVIYYAGDCNSGSKTIAINLPNDERVQLEKGSRRLQLKNAMQAKFDKILVPISEELVSEDQRKHITFDAFFANTMFHEVAHGLGIKNTINGKGTVRSALKEKGSALEEGKADILGLYMVTKLHDKGEIEGELMDYYVTFMAGIFRSVRFGASSAHGQANMIRFNYFQEMDAFSYDETTGRYSVNFDNFQNAMNSLSEKILTLQGDGDYDGVSKLFEEKGSVGPELQKSLDKVSEAGIPVDIVFNQGTEVLGL
ncbi:dipeptidyl-peptidase 3 family protein [Marinigracilibium pacificum]|uniref:Zn-dependent hydrolase n=1 Tax=Marinigracilibium pacificum TaxID=2729599 RepID=A0A848J5B5_9BACT|nr:Zn-dependent hydrolase [Marinigracilibium pacificum]NMM48342.1 Zn-dependent hydrolase [Marinigracilibium pacificum]